jgi:hypothetical protein
MRLAAQRRPARPLIVTSEKVWRVAPLFAGHRVEVIEDGMKQNGCGKEPGHDEDQAKAAPIEHPRGEPNSHEVEEPEHENADGQLDLRKGKDPSHREHEQRQEQKLVSVTLASAQHPEHGEKCSLACQLGIEIGIDERVSMLGERVSQQGDDEKKRCVAGNCREQGRAFETKKQEHIDQEHKRKAGKVHA